MHLLVCHSMYTTVLPSVYRSIIYCSLLLISLSLYHSICSSMLFIVCCSFYLSIIQFFVCSICSSVCHSMYLSIYHSIYRFLVLSIHSVHHSIHHSISPSLNYRHVHVYTKVVSPSYWWSIEKNICSCPWIMECGCPGLPLLIYF